MNDYFLRILIRQRQAEILAEVRSARHLQPVRFRVGSDNKSLHRFRSFILRVNAPWFSRLQRLLKE